MKKSIQSLAIASLAIAYSLFTSCTKSPTSSNLSAGQCSVSCDVSGATSGSYASSSLSSTAAKSAYFFLASNNTSLSSVEQFQLYIPLDVAVGSYNFKDLASSNLFLASYAKTNPSSGATQGWAISPDDDLDFTVNITKSSPTEIEGTFNGKMTEDNANTSITVSNGKFAAKF